MLVMQVKLIAEPWDCGGLYQVGGFPNWDVWGEWNGKYRDDVRRFIKGDAGLKQAFATRICGSADLYHVNNRCYATKCQQTVAVYICMQLYCAVATACCHDKELLTKRELADDPACDAL